MCGIAGWWSPDGGPIDRASLVRMTRALAHRGPDGEGYLIEPGIGLGHRRLSIIDPAGGAQPIANEDESVHVVFNGEIFNYLELRDALEARGHVFTTRSDTETLVHLYEDHGPDFVEQLNGQFAIALWDRRRRRLVLARDRVGIRPLFTADLPDGGLLFGSEVKAILAQGRVAARLDPVAIGQAAALWAPIPPRTPFVGIEELLPGSLRVLERDRRSTRRYWQHRFPRPHEYEERPITAWQEDLRALLHDAVRLQLRSDVAVAACLSGGLDSSILTALVRKQEVNDLTSFSVGFADARFDERAWQQKMVAHLGTDHREVLVDAARIGGDFSDVVWFAEKPLMRTAPAPLLALSKLVRESGIKVVLTGEGADELFGGYDLFREDKLRRFWAVQPDSTWRPALLSRLYGYVERDAKAEAFWRQFFARDLTATDDPFYAHRRRWDNGAHLLRYFTPDLRAQMQDEAAMLDELDTYLGPERLHWHPLARAQHTEMALFMSNYLLNSQGDRMTMGHSVEGRVPFLDHRLIEFASRIPPRLKIRGLDEKWILRSTFADLLPADIAQRPKQPYRAPISASFGAGQRNLARELMAPGPLARTGYVQPGAFARLAARMDAGVAMGERDEMAVAIVASLQLLHHHFVEPVSDQPMAPAVAAGPTTVLQ